MHIHRHRPTDAVVCVVCVWQDTLNRAFQQRSAQASTTSKARRTGVLAANMFRPIVPCIRTYTKAPPHASSMHVYVRKHAAASSSLLYTQRRWRYEPRARTIKPVWGKNKENSHMKERRCSSSNSSQMHVRWDFEFVCAVHCSPRCMRIVRSWSPGEQQYIIYILS